MLLLSLFYLLIFTYYQISSN